MINRRMWMMQSGGQISQKVPLNTLLIPVLSGMSTENGVVTGSTPSDSANHVNPSDTSSINTNIRNNAYRMFDRTENQLYFGNKTDDSRDIRYTLPSTLYNGWFTPGSYKFIVTLCELSQNLMVSKLIYVRNTRGEWVQVYDMPYRYNQQLYNLELPFTVNFYFDSIRMYHKNPQNYVHSRYYYIYGMNLIKTAELS